jgi:hypothetical protein
MPEIDDAVRTARRAPNSSALQTELGGSFSSRPMARTPKLLIGIKTDRATYDLIQTAKQQQEFVLEFHARVREQLPGEILTELQKSGDSSDIEDGVRKFVEWIKSGKLEVRAYPSERLHAKLYVMTFADGHIDKGRVITGSSNLTEAGLQDNLEFNVELKNRSDYDFAIQKFNERSTRRRRRSCSWSLVGPLVVAGCDGEMLARLLHGLRRPYQYRPGSIYLDWANACWRLLPVAKQPNPPQVLADWLDSLKESGDREQLEDIARDVAAALKSLPQEAPEPRT